MPVHAHHSGKETMQLLLKDLVRELSPPILLKIARRAKNAISRCKEMNEIGKEKSAQWYDSTYQESTEYRKHYAESSYYFLWTVIADRLKRGGVQKKILDLGCGPGQFAALLRDKGFSGYCGLDLSAEAVALARQKCPSFEFVAADVVSSDLLERQGYDCVIALEFLEHVTDDLGVLRRIRPGSRVCGSVPNFPYVSHVRHFTSEAEVLRRYSSLFTEVSVEAFRKNAKGSVLYLLEGIRS